MRYSLHFCCCSNFEWEYMKAEGNKHFKKNEMEQALRWYRSGIVICPPGKDRALLHRCDSRDAL